MMARRSLGVLFFLLFSVLTLSAYWPGTAGELLLDDTPSLAPLEKLVSEPKYFWDEVFGNNTGPLGRSVSMLSFAIDYAVFGGSSGTLKQHSIAIHLLNACLVAWLTSLLLAVRGFSNAWLLGACAGAYWLVAPQHTSTVLYVVQRMAMLSTMLTLIAVIGFVKFRAARSDSVRLLWFILFLGSIFLAPFAKENGVVAIPLIVLIELLWLRGSRLKGWFESSAHAIIVFIICICLAAALILVGWDRIEGGYQIRQFTLEQRLLTQGVAILDYAKQFYLPDLSLLSIYHDDFPVSESLLGESKSLFSWMAISAVLIFGIIGLITQKCLELVFATAAFLACHSVESSILALEIYFEHRNYLPSVFLAMLPCFALALLVRKATAEALSPIIAVGSIWLFYLLLQTSSQVQIWSNNTMLGLHMLSGHPGSARANTAFSRNLAQLGDYEKSIEYSLRAFNANKSHLSARGERESDMRLRNIALACMSGRGAPDDQVELLGMPDRLRPVSEYIVLQVFSELVREDVCPDFNWVLVSNRLAAIFLSQHSEASASMGVYMRLAAFENALGNMLFASQYTSLALKESPGNATLLLMQLHFLAKLQKFDEAILVRRQIENLKELGKLDVQQVETLGLYPEALLIE